GNPISHFHRSAWTRHANHLLRDVQRFGREHRSEDADYDVEVVIGELVEIGRVALFEATVGQTLTFCPAIPGRDEVTRDIDTQHVRSESRRRQGCRSITAAEVEDLLSFGDPQIVDQRLAARSHAFGDTREVALFPERFVRIHDSPPAWCRLA